MVKPETDEGEDGPPDARDFRDELPTLGAKETSKTDQPVAADAAKEYLVPMRSELFLGCEGNRLGLVGL